METHSTLTFSVFISAIAKVKPLLKSLDSNLQGLDFDFFQKTKHYRNLFWRHAPTPFFKMSQDFVFQIYVLLFLLQIHVPGYWDLNLGRKNEGFSLRVWIGHTPQ